MLSGARIVRIATHPDYARMGYGQRAIEALNSFYSGELYNFDEAAEENGVEGESFAKAAKVGPVSVRNQMPSLSTFCLGESKGIRTYQSCPC